MLTTKLRFISYLIVFLDAGQVALIFEREPIRQALINRRCRRINVAQSLADLYAITRQSIRTDRLPFCLHQHLWFMLFEILGSAELRSSGTGYSDANTFDAMVKNGQMPRARLFGKRRRAWDVRQLDIAIDELPFDGNNTRVDETWSDVDAPEAAPSR